MRARNHSLFAQMLEPDAFVIEAQPEFSHGLAAARAGELLLPASATAGFRAPMVDEASLAEPRFTLGTLLPWGVTYWRVATNTARGARGRSPILKAAGWPMPTGRAYRAAGDRDDEVLKLRWRAGVDSPLPASDQRRS
ncbi:MAG: hypothetical protein H6948_09535 [Zoogloeaceae bacterium]|nr:hypothetical protein [Zoogloeaceae bacterium]